MRNWDTDQIIRLFFESAQIALRIKNDPQTVVKDDHTPVTLADRKIEDFLTSELAEDGVFLIGEETFSSRGKAYLDQALKSPCWIIDPIDGTANFASGHVMWGISIGFAENGILQQGGVCFPELGEIMLTDGSRVLYGKIHDPGTAEDVKNSLSELKVPEKPFTETSVLNLSQFLVRAGTIHMYNPVLAVGSCAYAGMTLATGRDGAYVTRAKLWDLAGHLPCLAGLGFHSAALEKGSDRNILSLRILPEYYILDYSEKAAFRLTGHVIFAKDPTAIEKIREGCRI